MEFIKRKLLGLRPGRSVGRNIHFILLRSLQKITRASKYSAKLVWGFECGKSLVFVCCCTVFVHSEFSQENINFLRMLLTETAIISSKGLTSENLNGIGGG